MQPLQRGSSKNDFAAKRFDEMLEALTEEDFKAEIDFIGTDPLTIKTTSAQEIFNCYQMFPKVLV
jgi:hypothetical protein